MKPNMTPQAVREHNARSARTVLLWLFPALLVLLSCAIVPEFGSASLDSRPRWACPSPTPLPYGAEGPRRPDCCCERDEDGDCESRDCPECYLYEWEQEYGSNLPCDGCGQLLRGQPAFEGPPFPSPTPFHWKGTNYVFGQRVELDPLYATMSVSSAGGSPSGAVLAVGDYRLEGAPSLTAAEIDSILENRGSDAAGTGSAWIAAGQRTGIDPIYALAFFGKESTFGTNSRWAGWIGAPPNGLTTHNIGNIRCAGASSCHNGFRSYSSWEEGINAWFDLIRNEYIDGRGHQVVSDVIPVFAPSFENNVTRYVNTVHDLVDQWRRQSTVEPGGGDDEGDEESPDDIVVFDDGTQWQIHRVSIDWVNNETDEAGSGVPMPIDYATQLRLRSVRDADGRLIQDEVWVMTDRALRESGLSRPPDEIPSGNSSVTVPILGPVGSAYSAELVFRTGERYRHPEGTPTPTPTVEGTTVPAELEPHRERGERNHTVVQWIDSTYDKMNHVDDECADGPGAMTNWSSEGGWGSDVALYVDAPPLSKAIAASALAQVGRPYVWGGINDTGIGDCLSGAGCFNPGYHRDFPNGTTGFDCSGLMVWAYGQHGVRVPWRTTFTQWPNLNPVSEGGMQVADMAYFGGVGPGAGVSHVGMMVGDIGTSKNNPAPDGKWDFVHAPHINSYIRVEYDFFGTYAPYAGYMGLRTMRGIDNYDGY